MENQHPESIASGMEIIQPSGSAWFSDLESEAMTMPMPMLHRPVSRKIKNASHRLPIISIPIAQAAAIKIIICPIAITTRHKE